MQENTPKKQDVTPLSKQPFLAEQVVIDIYRLPDGTPHHAEWAIIAGDTRKVGSAQYWRVSIGDITRALGLIDAGWERLRNNGKGGGGVALVDTVTCRNCDQAVNADEMIHEAHGRSHCPACDARYDAFNAELDRYEDAPKYRAGDICPGAFHEDWNCEFCNFGALTAEGAADINAELKHEHERKLTKIVDAMPHSELAKIVSRTMALSGLKPRRDVTPVDDLPY